MPAKLKELDSPIIIDTYTNSSSLAVTGVFHSNSQCRSQQIDVMPSRTVSLRILTKIIYMTGSNVLVSLLHHSIHPLQALTETKDAKALTDALDRLDQD